MSFCEICGRPIEDGTVPGRLTYRDCGERAREVTSNVVCHYCVHAVVKIVQRRKATGARYMSCNSLPCRCRGGEESGFDGVECKFFHGRKVTKTCLCGLRTTEIEEARCNKSCSCYTEFKPIPGRFGRHE